MGKRALVTGGSRGIGAAIARRLAADGAAVAINYVADQSFAAYFGYGLVMVAVDPSSLVSVSHPAGAPLRHGDVLAMGGPGRTVGA